MSLALGIDTGGTYTDAVIYDTHARAVLCFAKSPTTKQDLTIGIMGALTALDSALLPRVKYVSLSTTLATNACVEGKGGRAALIFIGGDKKIVEQTKAEYGIMPGDAIYYLDGNMSMAGDVIQEPDWEAFRQQIAPLCAKEEYFALSAQWATHNSYFESRAKEIIEELGSGAVCGHMLANDQYNYIRRGATALLNAQLIPLICDFLLSVKQSLGRLGITAPVYIVRSDASLMSEAFATSRPVETLLCGPCASVLGAMTLCADGETPPNAVIADMGGTTTDIAFIDGGVPATSTSDTKIGRWSTTISSLLVETCALGGDSRLGLDKQNRLQLHDRRVAPLCMAAKEHPCVLKLLKHACDYGSKQPFECFYLLRPIVQDDYYNAEEQAFCAALATPNTFESACEAAGLDKYRVDIARLERHGVIMRCGFTPTDCLHILGKFDAGDAQASLMGAKLIGRRLGADERDTAKAGLALVSKKLYSSIVTALLRKQGMNPGEETARLIDAAFAANAKGVTPSFSSACDLLGVGAPIHHFLGGVAEQLSANGRLSENAGVANAIGAAVCRVMARVQVQILPQSGGESGAFMVTGQSEPRHFIEYENALEFAKTSAAKLATTQAKERGLTNPASPKVTESICQIYPPDAAPEDSAVFISATITATVGGSIAT